MYLLRPAIRVAGALLALVVFLAQPALPAAAQHGCDPGNLIANCDFEDFSGNLPTGWAAQVLSGQVDFRQVTGPESHSSYGNSSLLLTSGDAYVAVVYAQIGGVQPGAAYVASLGWGAPAAPTETFGRQLGIDPTGGTNPNSPSVVWGHMHWGDARRLNYPPPDVNIDVSAVAQAPTITVYIKVDHNQPVWNSLIFLDAIGLYEDTSVPRQSPPTPMPPTAEPAIAAPAKQAAPAAAASARQAVPPTAAPRRPTARPTATATLTPTPTLTLTPTSTATATATATPTITPTPLPTFTPTPTPSSTLPPRPSATPGAAAGKSAGIASSAGGQPGFLWGGLGALGGAGLLGALLLTGQGDE